MGSLPTGVTERGVGELCDFQQITFSNPNISSHRYDMFTHESETYTVVLSLLSKPK